MALILELGAMKPLWRLSVQKNVDKSYYNLSNVSFLVVPHASITLIFYHFASLQWSGGYLQVTCSRERFVRTSSPCCSFLLSTVDGNTQRN